MMLYTIPRFENIQEFLALVAQRMGRLRKGGIPNVEAAAKVILGDWNAGKIPFYTLPPPVPISAEGEAAMIVSSWAPEFDIEAIGRMEVDTVLQKVPEELPRPSPWGR